MRGAYGALVAVLLVLLGASILVVFYTQMTSITSRAMLISEKESEAMTLTEKYIDVTTAKIGYLDKNTGLVEVSIYIHSSSPKPIFYNIISLYLYKKDTLKDTTTVSSLSPPCTGEEIPPGALCEIKTTMFYEPNADLQEARLKVFLNRHPIYTEPIPSSWPGVPLYSESCSSCSECTALLSSAPSGTLVVVNPLTASGDCITVSSPDVRVVCRDYIQGNGSGTGILVEANNVTIERCVVKGFEKGIVLDNVKGTTVSGVVLENNLDMELVADSPELCNQSEISAYGTDGKIVYTEGTLDSLLTIQGLWVYGADGASISSASLSRTSPALLICSSNNFSASSLSISSTPLGILAISDSNTSLSNISISSDVNLGIKSIATSFASLSNIVLNSLNGALFENPDEVSVSDLNVS